MPEREQYNNISQLNKISVQPKLEIGEENDEHEREANTVANKVMRAKDDEKHSAVSHISSGIKKMTVPTASIKKMSVNSARKMFTGTSGSNASPRVEQEISNSKGNGSPLSPEIQQEMGSKIGADFSDVKIHTDESAVDMNQEIGARAFTYGNDIYFNNGQYNPSSDSGKHLLAHELTHTIQQKSNSISRKILLSRLRDFINIKQEDLNLTNTDIEGTNEYKAYMDPVLVWQKELKLSADEARLACLLILNDMREGKAVNWENEARNFALMARDRLNQRGRGIEGPKRLTTEISVVTETRAQELFDQMSTLTFFNDKGKETPVPFHYPADGCYARAHLMSERLTAMGYASNKKFVMSTKAGGLTVNSNYSKDAAVGQQATTTWWYHVAPIIQVKKEDQTIVDMIIDPSLSDHPLTVDEWTGLMRSDSFTEMPLGDIEKFVTDNGYYPGNSNITYSADRSTYGPSEFYKSEDKEHEEAEMNASRPRISDYAQKAQVHELAYLIRSEIKKGPGKIDVLAITSKIKSLDSSQKTYFKISFPNLVSELNGMLTQPEIDSIKTELDK